MSAYYNEIDPYAAEWLRNLIKAGHIAPGFVDERSITDVKPEELRGYTQCHFFAGVGVWSLALRRAGWPDDKPVWTGSCPCQPFSAAGKGDGFTDERHLWPHWYHLITQCRPSVVFGEQVASKDGLGWLDLVQADLEGADYASAAVDLCAAGVGAPHIRQRLWFVAESLENAERERRRGECERPYEPEIQRLESSEVQVTGLCGASGVADSNGDHDGVEERGGSRAPKGVPGEYGPEECSPGEPGGADIALCGVANTNLSGSGAPERCSDRNGPEIEQERSNISQSECGGRCTATTEHGPAAPTNSLWRDVDWLFCRDGKWRPVRPGSFPLVNGYPSRVGRLRAYGNAINAEAATQFIGAYLES